MTNHTHHEFNTVSSTKGKASTFQSLVKSTVQLVVYLSFLIYNYLPGTFFHLENAWKSLLPTSLALYISLFCRVINVYNIYIYNYIKYFNE